VVRPHCTTKPEPIMTLRTLRRSLSAILALALLFICTGTFAASPVVDARLSVALIQFNGQFETSSPASTVKPGDVLEYSARYGNRGDAAADALTPTMPIPVGTEYVPAGTSPKPTHASLDAITYAPIPLHRKERGADGQMHDVEVPLSEYRAVKWSVGTLAPGSEVIVRARVRVIQPTAIAGR
jgi:uncharacterized repeat protein (TIGR01451 family)